MESLLEKILEIYGLDLTFVEKVQQGFLSDNYVLTDGSANYFLKKYRDKKAEKIKEIHLAKNFFKEGSIPVIMPLRTKNHESFFEYDKDFYALFPFQIGRQLNGKIISEKALISLAEMLAKIHLVGKESVLPITSFFKPWNKEKLLTKVDDILKVISHIEHKTDFDLKALSSILLTKKFIETNQRTYEEFGLKNDHLIHGDYYISNVFFDEEDNISFVFDFEKTRYAPRSFELFRSLVYTDFFDGSITPEILSRAKLYLDAYNNIYPMSKEELENGFEAYRLFLLHSVWILSEHYLENNHRIDSLFPTTIARNYNLSENFGKIKGYLFGESK